MFLSPFIVLSSICFLIFSLGLLLMLPLLKSTLRMTFFILCLKPVQINIRLKLTAQRACRLSGKHDKFYHFYLHRVDTTTLHTFTIYEQLSKLADTKICIGWTLVFRKCKKLRLAMGPFQIAIPHVEFNS